MDVSMEAISAGLAVMNLLFILFTLSVERKNATTAASWILLLLFLPVLGFILYLLFGTNIFIRRKKLFRRKRAQDSVFNAAYRPFLPQDKNATEVLEDIARFNCRLDCCTLTQRNDVQLFFTAEEKYCALLEDIERAQDHIHMQYFILRNDLIGRLILEALEKKARDGVKVRVLYDHGGSILTPAAAFARLRTAGAEVAAFFPIRLGHYLRVNFRNHRKLVVVDGATAYTGGMNIGDEYMNRYKKRGVVWRDTHLRLCGDGALFMQLQFLKDWQFATGKKVAASSKLFPIGVSHARMLVEIVSSGPDTAENEIKWNFLKLIYGAKESVLIQSPYFVPDDSFMEALKIAALSGCRVQVIAPQVSDNAVVQVVSEAYLGELLPYGVEVYIYKGFLHAKMLLVDDFAVSIGSANMDMRSFELNFELNAFFYDKKIAALCRRQFEQDLRASLPYTLEMHRARSFWRRTQEGVFRLLAPLM